MDPHIAIYFSRTDKKFSKDFETDADAGSILEQAKFYLRTDKNMPFNEESLNYYLQLIHENILSKTLVN